MGDARDSTRLAAATAEAEQATRNSEFWYLCFKYALATVVRSAGVEAAEELADVVHDAACCGFPDSDSDWRVSEPAASLIMEDIRVLASEWEQHGTIVRKGDDRRG